MDNIHTYAHARRVRNAPQRISMRYQTFLWPTSEPHFFPPELDDLCYEPSEFGPPVRTVEDLIAYQHLLKHRPDVFKLNTSTVLDSVNDHELDSYERQRKQQATRKFREKYASYTSQFDRETQNTSRQKPKKTKKPKEPKRSKFFDDMTPGSVNTWNSTGLQASEIVPVHYAEEIILPPCSYTIVECTEPIPAAQYATFTSVAQPQRATVTTVEVKVESSERPSCSQQDSGSTWSTATKVVRWSRYSTRMYSLFTRRRVRGKICSSKVRRTFIRKGVLPSHHLIDRNIAINKQKPVVMVFKNYKKRRRKCESEHAH